MDQCTAAVDSGEGIPAGEEASGVGPIGAVAAQHIQCAVAVQQLRPVGAVAVETRGVAKETRAVRQAVPYTSSSFSVKFRFYSA